MKRILLIHLLFLTISNSYAQNMGIKLTAGATPNTTLDVNGAVSYREGTALTLANGVNSDIALGDYSMFRITNPTAAFSITGFAGGVDGRILTIINATTQTMTLSHQVTSTAANQLNTGGSSINIAANGVATLIYNTTLTKWVVSGTIGSTPNFTNITNGSFSDSLVVINNGDPRRVPPEDYVETYAWGLDGNAGTVDGTNFLGTTDAVPFNIRVNNQKAGRISSSNDNTHFGYQAGNVATGTGNTFVGYQAGDVNTSGESNTVVGANAFGSNTGGKDNVAIGFEALKVNTADDNTAVGKLALTANTTGTHNVAVGEGSMQTNTIGVQNVALGRQTLQFNTKGESNTALGYSAMLNNTTADRNVAVGKNALLAQSFSNVNTNYNSQNVAVGYDALAVNQPTTSSNGINNTAVGYQSGKANTTGTNNTFIGNYAGEGNTTGSNNATLGYQAGNNITTGSNNIAVGYQATVPTATASNQLSIGNWIYGVGGNIGIGTVAPTQKLHVVGSICYTVGIAACSDARYKQDISRFETPLSKLLLLNGLYYHWNTKAFPNHGFTDTRQIGFLAQEVEPYFPEVVLTDKEGYKSVDYGRLTPVIVEAMKELQTQIEQLKKENEQLKALKAGLDKNSQEIEVIKAMLTKKQN